MDPHASIDARHAFNGVALGDARLDRRCLRIAEALQERPAASFTEAMGSDAAAEALYRFMGNAKTDHQALADAHRDPTFERALSLGRVLALHDTSVCQFAGV